MIKEKRDVVVLIVEDDDDDYMLTHDALKESRLINEMRRVKDGEELMDYLLHKGSYKNPKDSPSPLLILLDLNLPRKDGREALKEIKSNPDLRRIPIVILTTSKADEDILRSYDLGVNSFIRKPVNFEQFIHVVKILGEYWFDVVELPKKQ